MEQQNKIAREAMECLYGGFQEEVWKKLSSYSIFPITGRTKWFMWTYKTAVHHLKITNAHGFPESWAGSGFSQNLLLRSYDCQKSSVRSAYRTAYKSIEMFLNYIYFIAMYGIYTYLNQQIRATLMLNTSSPGFHSGLQENLKSLGG